MSGEIEVGGMHWVRDRRDRWIGNEDNAALATEAAMLDEIERLRAEVISMRGERDSAQTQCRHLSDRIASNTAERAENERLRAALRYISSPTMSLPGDAAVRLALQTCIRMAREALTNGSAGATDAGGQP